MKKTLLALTSLAGLALALTGCSSVGELVLLDKGVKNSVTCRDLSEKRLSDGRLQVAAQLRNLENRRIQVQVDCQFQTADGLVIDSTPFQNVILTENSEEDVQFVSMNDKAVRYSIRVREAR